MPAKTDARGLFIPPEYDARRKLTDEERREIVKLYTEERDEWSMRRLAARFGVSRRLIQFTIYPERHAENLKRRAERGGYKTDTARQTEYMRRHRAHKKKLMEEGKLTDHGRA